MVNYNMGRTILLYHQLHQRVKSHLEGKDEGKGKTRNKSEKKFNF